MIKPLVAGNWKMHGSTEKASNLAAQLAEQWGDNLAVEMVLFPPFVHLSAVKAAVANTGIAVGAQNISQHSSGAYTGEISGAMLVDQGCDYVLVGHSERRELFSESNQTVAEKFKAAQDVGLTPILCVGESLQQRQQEQTLDVVAAQIAAVIDCVGLSNVCRAVIAYEPVWAIGTGLTASPAQAQEVHQAIRAHVAAVAPEQARGLKILYGGSVTAASAEELFAQADIDGGLVGGASLQADSFLAIGQAAK